MLLAEGFKVYLRQTGSASLLQLLLYPGIIFVIFVIAVLHSSIAIGTSDGVRHLGWVEDNQIDNSTSICS